MGDHSEVFVGMDVSKSKISVALADGSRGAEVRYWGEIEASDAAGLARLLRAGELTRVWVPDDRHEAMRDLVRARGSAADDLRVKRQQTSAFLLRLSRIYRGKRTWGGAHKKWLLGQSFAHLEQRLAVE